MSSIDTRSAARAAPAWPVVLWLLQLPFALGIASLGVIRITRGPQAGVLVWSAMAVSVAWLALATGVAVRGAGRRWIVANRYQLLLSAVVSVVMLVFVGEAAIRILSTTDEDGNVYTLGHHLPPRRLPVKRIEAAVRTYRAAATTVIVDDRDVGWEPRPGSQNALYAYNRDTIRVASVSVEYPSAPSPGTDRLAIFGDSFTNGVDVPYGETWGVQLEEALRGMGRRTEVLNFGVPGYGMDQAYLRWRKRGPAYAPAIVLFGLQIENVKRNVNVLRPLYNRFTDLPFSKPRLVPSGQGLTTRNVPTLSPEVLAATIANIDAWPLVRYEGFYRADDYRRRPWHASKLLAFGALMARQVAGGEDRDDLASTSEVDLALRILEEFKKSVDATGARFVVVHLPRRGDLKALDDEGALPNRALLEQVRSRFAYVETADALIAEARTSSLRALFNKSAHYSGVGNRTVARAVSEALAPQLTSRHTR